MSILTELREIIDELPQRIADTVQLEKPELPSEEVADAPGMVGGDLTQDAGIFANAIKIQVEQAEKEESLQPDTTFQSPQEPSPFAPQVPQLDQEDDQIPWNREDWFTSDRRDHPEDYGIELTEPAEPQQEDWWKRDQRQHPEDYPIELEEPGGPEKDDLFSRTQREIDEAIMDEHYTRPGFNLQAEEELEIEEAEKESGDVMFEDKAERGMVDILERIAEGIEELVDQAGGGEGGDFDDGGDLPMEPQDVGWDE